MSISTSFSVDISPAATQGVTVSAYADIKLAGRLNGGKTVFAPGSEVSFYVVKSSNVKLETPVVSSGSMSSAGKSESLKGMDILIFKYPNQMSASLKMPASSGFSPSWQGKSLGTPVLQADQMTVIVSKPSGKLSSQKGNDTDIGVLVVNYSTQASIYKLYLPDEVDGSSSFTVAGFIPATVSVR